jgi:NAD-dependent SIR2 family protein deacetylase
VVACSPCYFAYNAGAGISVAAGIPSFRGEDGLYTTSTLPGFEKKKIVGLFSYSTFTVSKVACEQVRWIINFPIRTHQINQNTVN